MPKIYLIGVSREDAKKKNREIEKQKRPLVLKTYTTKTLVNNIAPENYKSIILYCTEAGTNKLKQTWTLDL